MLRGQSPRHQNSLCLRAQNGHRGHITSFKAEGASSCTRRLRRRSINVVKAQIPSEAASRSLVTLNVREPKIVENESNINKKVLASAAVVCLATQFLTVQGLLLTAYAATLTAVPVGAVRHALKKRNAWPALFLLSSAILIPNVAILRGAYTSLVNPVSVHLKARITLPAVVHAFVGSKHPILKSTLQGAQLISQIVLVGLLLQYLLAPKIAEAMRQRAIMLCRALTTTESQGLKKERGKTGRMDPEDWMQSLKAEQKESESSSGFMGSITRGNPRRREMTKAEFKSSSQGSQQKKAPLNLPEGQQPRIQEVYAHAGKEYAYVNAKKTLQQSGQLAYGQENIQGANLQDLFNQPSEEEIEKAKADLAELGLSFESEIEGDVQTDGLDNPQLDSVVGSITSTEELFTVLNQQLNMVQDLADEVRTKGIALKHSEYAREDLVRELKATVGERNSINEELSQLTLKFEAAQSMWEKHLEQGGSFSDLISEEVLDKVVEALKERKRNLLLDYVDVRPQDDEKSQLQIKDPIAAKFRVFPDEIPDSKEISVAQNNAQPFERNQLKRESREKVEAKEEIEH